MKLDNRQVAWAYIAPFALIWAGLALRSVLAAAFAPGEAPDLRWLYGAQSLAALFALSFFAPAYTELATTRSGTLRQYAAAAATGLGVFVLWILPLPRLPSINFATAHFSALGTDGRLDPVLALVHCAGSVLVIPVVEELFWRSFLMRWIDRRDFSNLAPQQTSTFAVLGSSLAFAMEHEQVAAGLAAGLAYALIYRRSGSLRHAIFAHATTNLALAAWVISRNAWEFW